MLLRLECSEAELAAMRAAGPPRRYEGLDATAPLVTLVEQLTRRADRGYIHVRKGDLSLTLGRRGAHEPPGEPTET